MERAARGPVLLVQDRGTTELQQLRPDGSRLVLDAFPYDTPAPRRRGGPDRALGRVRDVVRPGDRTLGLVVRDLGTGDIVVSRRTQLPYAVRDWTTGGVVLEVALDPGGPPYAWHPGRDGLRRSRRRYRATVVRSPGCCAAPGAAGPPSAAAPGS